MKGRLRILYLSSEIAPFAKTGGLADVASALPKALHEMGHEIRLMMPKYGCINERKYTLREVIRLKNVPVKSGDGQVITGVKSAFLPDTKVQIYFLDYKPAFGRHQLYVDPKTKTDFIDNAERFAIFSRGVLETLKILHWEPNVIHCNDWQTSLIPILLKTEYANDPFFKKMTTLLTIHNLAYQGVFNSDVLAQIALSDQLLTEGSDFEFYGKVNFLKAGILNADMLTTVSDKYAQEVQSDPEFGCGLEGVLSGRKDSFVGILNGVDYDLWNPETDELIPQNYSITNLDKKIENKKALLKNNNLEFKERTPVIGMISRLADQKGFDLIADALDDLMKLNIQMVILGTGDARYHEMFETLRVKFPQKLAVNLKYDNELAHLIEAGSDMFLMPSRYEPCGLNQMYSLKYGTVPIVRTTGGLADTIEEFDLENDRGNGFVFKEYSSQEMLKAIKRAVDLYVDQDVWQDLRKKGMRQNFSWQTSAEKYIKLYSKIEAYNRKE